MSKLVNIASVGLILIGLSLPQVGSTQCSGGALQGAITPIAAWQTIIVSPNAGVGTYLNFPTTAGNQYHFSYCAANGGSAAFDTQLTILNNAGGYAGGYNDDFCGLQSEVLWTAPTSGTYRVLTNQFFCADNTSSGLLAYRELGPAGPGANCGNPDVIASVPFAATGLTTCGYGDDYSSLDACNSSYMNGDDYVFEYTPPVNQCIQVTLTNTGTWTGVFVTDGCPAGGTCVAFDTQVGGNPQVTNVNLTGGNTYYITVSTFPSPQCTPFDIDIDTCPPPPPPMCYAISGIPFAPDPYAGTLVTLSDDAYSNAVNIGFNFCYDNNTYNQCLIASNNYVDFDLTHAAAYSPWVISAPIPSLTPAELFNTVLAPWEDIHPGLGGQIRYQTLGVAPFRRFVVSWNQVPMFSCTGQLYTSQVKLFETTNCIEIHLANKPSCPTWNGGFAIQGLHNINGTQASVIAGRNHPVVWSASNDAQRLSPTCAPCDAGGGCVVVLPVEMLDLTGENLGKVNQLRWATAAETNSSHFVVEKSVDGVNFEAIGSVDASGTTNFESNYQFMDENPAKGVNYYRLQPEDNDGVYYYSDIITVETPLDAELKVNLFPNPGNKNEALNVQLSNLNDNEEVLLVLRDVLGNEVYSKAVVAENGHVLTAMELDHSIAPGIYLVIGSSNHTQLFQRKVIIK